MAMSAEEFDAAIAGISNMSSDPAYGGGYGLTDSKVEEKRASLFDKSIQKEQDVYGQATPATVQKVVDGDTYIGSDGINRRQAGYDSYETFREETDYSDPKVQSRLNRQKLRLAAEKGVDPSQLTDEDIFAEGNKERLQNLYEMTRAPGDTPWTPGPSTGTEFLGSDQNPLNIPIREQQGETDAYGRVVSSAFNPNTQGNVNTGMMRDDNALIFDTGAKRPNQREMALQNAAVAAQEKGSALTPKELAAFGMTPKSAKKSFRDAADAKMASTEPQTSADGYWGEAVDATQAGLARQAARAVDAIGDVAFSGNTNVKLPFLDKGIEHYKDQRVVDKEFGVNSKRWEAENAKFDDVWDKGDIFGIIKQGLYMAPQTLGSSAGEIVSLANPLLAGTAVMARVNDNIDEYAENNNGEEMNAGQILTSTATNFAALFAERFLIKAGFGDITKGLTGPAKNFKNALGKKVGSIFMSGSGEFLQEGFDSLQEELNTMKQNDKTYLGNLADKWNSDNTLKSAVLGGITGAGVKAAGETVSVPKILVDAGGRALDRRAIKSQEKQEVEAGKYVSDREDIDFVRSSQDAKKADLESEQKFTKSSIEALKNLESFDDVSTVDNKEIREAARYVLNKSGENVVSGSEEHKTFIGETIHESIGADPDTIAGWNDFLETDITGKTKNEVIDIIKNIDNDILKDLIDSEGLTTDDAAGLALARKKDETFPEFKKELDKILNLRVEGQNEQLDKVNKRRKNFERGFESNPEQAKKSTINLSEIDTAGVDTKGSSAKGLTGITKEIFSDVFLGKSRKGVSKATEQLNEYTSEALANARKEIKAKQVQNKTKGLDADPKLSTVDKAIEKLQEKRTKSDEMFGLNEKRREKARGLAIKKGNKAETISSLNTLLLQRKMEDTRDVEATQGLLDSAIEQGFLTDDQKSKYQRRLDKISEGHEMPDEKTVKQEKRQASRTKTTPEEDVVLKSNEIDESDLDAAISSLVDVVTNAKNDKEKASAQKRMNDLIQRKYQFSDHEAEMNERYSSIDGYLDGVEPISANQLTKAEQDILNLLNICK